MSVIQEIVRQNPRVRVFVPPNEWLDIHVSLLKAEFVISNPNDESQRVVDLSPESSGAMAEFQRGGGPADPRPYTREAHEAERLALGRNRNGAIRYLLAELVDSRHVDPGTPAKPPFVCKSNYGAFRFGPGLPHMYGRHGDYMFRLHGMTLHFNRPDAYRPGVMHPIPAHVAFMQRHLVTIQRESVYPRPRRRSVRNKPGETIRALQLKQLQPPDLKKDPYILAVLIGLCQEQAMVYHDLAKIQPGIVVDYDKVYKASLMIANQPNMEFMMFYWAHIGGRYLAKFNFPEELNDLRVDPDSEVQVHVCRIYYRPYATLRQRIWWAIRAHYDEI